MNDEIRIKLIMEQYKIFVESAQKISDTRSQTNKFFISILSILFAISALVSNFNNIIYLSVCTLVIGLFGILLCYLWYRSIHTYKALNSAKFAVIHEIEQELPIKCFIKEWDILEKCKKKEYLIITGTEKKLPILLALPFILIIILSIISLVFINNN